MFEIGNRFEFSQGNFEGPTWYLNVCDIFEGKNHGVVSGSSRLRTHFLRLLFLVEFVLRPKGTPPCSGLVDARNKQTTPSFSDVKCMSSMCGAAVSHIETSYVHLHDLHFALTFHIMSLLLGESTVAEMILVTVQLP